MNDLNQAYKNFFDSCTGKRKGIKVKGPDYFPADCCANVPRNAPRFKSRNSKQTARFVGANYKVGQDKIYLPKVGKVKIVWSRPKPRQPSSVTIIKDSAGRPSIVKDVG